LKARVDSKELSVAVAAAAKYSKTTGSGMTLCIRLKVTADWLELRTTNFTENAIVRVNAFDCEEGEAVTLTSHLLAAATDSGGWVRIRDTKKRLVLDYEVAPIRIGLMEIDAFPVWPSGERVASLPSGLLKTAASICTFGAAPVTDCVHLVSRNGIIYVMSSNSIIGIQGSIEGELPESLALDGTVLSKALSVLDGIVHIVVEKSVARLSCSDSASEISFSTTGLKSGVETWIDSIFNLDTLGGMTISKAELYKIVKWANVAAKIDEVSRLVLDGGSAEVVGREVNIDPFEIEYEGDFIPRMVFYTGMFARTIGTVRGEGPFSVLPAIVPGRDNISSIYIDGEDRLMLNGLSEK